MRRLIWYKCIDIGDLDQFNWSISLLCFERRVQPVIPFISGCGELREEGENKLGKSHMQAEYETVLFIDIPAQPA